MAIYDKIKVDDYNYVRNKVSNHLGYGYGQNGYGQQLQSVAVTEQSGVSASSWNDLRNDIINIYNHNDGTAPFISAPQHGDRIVYNSSMPANVYNLHIDNLAANKFKIAMSQSKTTSKGSRSQDWPGSLGTSWNNRLECNVTYNFSNSTTARWFFNSGGKIRLSSSRSGGNSTNQNQAWTSLLNSVGIVEFGAITPTAYTYYQLTSSYQRIFHAASSGSYAYYACEFNIYAKCNVPDNANGTANSIMFMVEWLDPYSGTNDSVDGTMTLSTNTLEASGQLVPSGFFQVESPQAILGNFTTS